MNKFIQGICIGVLISMLLQGSFGICNWACREAFIQKAVHDRAWAKDAGKEIYRRLMEERKIKK